MFHSKTEVNEGVSVKSNPWALQVDHCSILPNLHGDLQQTPDQGRIRLVGEGQYCHAQETMFIYSYIIK